MDEQAKSTPETPAEDDLRFAPSSEDSADVFHTDNAFSPTAHSLDIDAALAAVASLDDMLAEQEAAEQARVTRQQAEVEARAQREARLRNPEHFFPMPPLAPLKRGRIDSVVPAIALIGIGAWLTLMTTSAGFSSTSLIFPILMAALGVVLMARWVATGRWTAGNLFFALLLIFAGIAVFVMQNQVQFTNGWTFLVIAFGAAFIFSGLLSQPARRRLIFPGVLIALVGIISFVMTSGLLPWQG